MDTGYTFKVEQTAFDGLDIVIYAMPWLWPSLWPAVLFAFLLTFYQSGKISWSLMFLCFSVACLSVDLLSSILLGTLCPFLIWKLFLQCWEFFSMISLIISTLFFSVPFSRKSIIVMLDLLVWSSKLIFFLFFYLFLWSRLCENSSTSFANTSIEVLFPLS